MRLFIAIDLPEPIRDLLRPLWSEQLPGAKPVPFEQIHLTLRFLGEVSDTKTAELKVRLANFSSPAFSLRLSGLGVFPNPERPRVLWAGVPAEPELLSLQQRIEMTVQGLGLAPETKRYSPHLTLARLKFAAAREVGAFLQRHASLHSPDFEVREFHLYSSRLSPKGAEHRKEATYPIA